MKKEDFNYEYPEKYIDKSYVTDSNEYILIIEEDIFDEETIEYANNILNQFIVKKDEIIDTMLDLGLREFYKSLYDYSDEFIKENIGKPRIKIIYKNDGTKEWKFKYAGVITFLEHNLDEHIIEIEFMDDLKLDDNVIIDG